MMMITCLGEKREIKLKLVFRTGFRWCAIKAIIRLCIQNLLRSCTKEGGGGSVIVELLAGATIFFCEDFSWCRDVQM